MLTIEFLSVSGWLPENEAADTVSLLVNRHIMVDTGWNCVRNLLRAGVKPAPGIDTLFFTHIHQDHYLSLPGLLFYYLNGLHDVSPLTVMGPVGTKALVRQALSFAGYERFYDGVPLPTVRELESGENVALPDVTVSCTASHHAVPGLSYKFVNPENGKCCVYTGDTAPYDELSRFARHADAMIHENSWGAHRNPETRNDCGHSSAEEAAQDAAKAEVGALYLVHCFEDSRPACDEAARAIFPNVHSAVIGEKIVL